MRTAPALLLAIIAAAAIGPLALTGLPESYASSGQDTAQRGCIGAEARREGGAGQRHWSTRSSKAASGGHTSRAISG